MAKRIIDDAHTVYDRGPEVWSFRYTQTRADRSHGYLVKFDRLLAQGKTAHLFERICYYYTEMAIPYWFGKRAEWPLRPQEAFEYIAQKDPDYYTQLAKIFSDTTNKEKVAACKEIHKMLFE